MSLLAATAALLVLGPAPAVKSIRIERSPCFGRCPVYSATLYADGRIRYHGGANVSHLGDHQIKDPSMSIAKIGSMATKLGFFQLKNRYEEPMTDLASITLTIERGKESKSVYCYGEGPDEIWLLAIAIDKVIDDTFEWTERMKKFDDEISKRGLGKSGAPKPQYRPTSIARFRTYT